MALIDILEKITKDTDMQIDRLEKEFNEKKKEIEEENARKKKQIEEDMEEKVTEKHKKVLEKAATLAERESKNQLLQAKRATIDTALKSAIEMLVNSEKYEEILVEMLKKTAIDDEDTVVIPAKGKEEETKRAIKKSEKKYFFSEKSGHIKGGFIIKTAKVEIDNSFETIINEQLRDTLEIKLNNSLFT